MNKELQQIGIVTNGGVIGHTDFNAYENRLVGISGCMVLLIDRGFAIVSVGFRRRVLRKGMLAVLFYDDTFWVECSSRSFRCRYVSFSEANVQEAIYKLSSPYFWDSLSEDPIFLLGREQQRLIDGWYSQMEWICHRVVDEYMDTMLRNNLYNLFMAMDNEITQIGAVEKKAISRNRELIIRFLKLLTQHCCHTREVSFYAQKLCISTTYLYKLTNKRLNLSPKQLIDQQTICEIKTLLLNTNLTVKEIAYSMHFDDTPYMCRYFRRHTGRSPMEYRYGK